LHPKGGGKVMRSKFLLIAGLVLLLEMLFSCMAYDTGPSSNDTKILVSSEFGISGGEDEYIPDEYVLQLEPTKGVSSLTSLSGDLQILRSYSFNDVQIVVVKTKDPSAFESIEGIRSVDKNYIYRALAVPNDSLYSYQWHYDAIKLPQAWDIVNSASVVVAVVDTGVGFTHQDLQGIFVQGYDFVDGDTDPTDPAQSESHGTHVTGTIAALTNNFLGVAGVNWGGYGIKIMPVRVLGADGSGTLDAVAAGIRFATDNGAKIINLSLGGPGAQVFMDVVKYAYSKNVTLVCAAGNEYSSSLTYPAAYVEAIAIGSIRYDLTRSYYSNYNYTRYYDPYKRAYVKHYIDFVAPGGDLTVDQNGDGYGDGVLSTSWTPTDGDVYMFLQGTSMASPHAAAVAAMLYARGYTTPEAIRTRLRQTAYKIPSYMFNSSGWNEEVGYGLLDAYAAVR